MRRTTLRHLASSLYISTQYEPMLIYSQAMKRFHAGKEIEAMKHLALRHFNAFGAQLLLPENKFTNVA
jgi:hypothetical protein